MKSKKSLYRDPTNCLPHRSPELPSTPFGTLVRSNCSHETNCAVKELALPHLTLDGRAVTPGEARSFRCFCALPSSQIIACLRHRKWWRSMWTKALRIRFPCLSFYSRPCDLGKRSTFKRCQAARPQQPPAVASSHPRRTQPAQQRFELQTVQLHNGCRQGNPGRL